MLALSVRCARHAWLGAVLFLGALLTALPASGSVVLAQVVSNILNPTDIQNAGDGSGRLFFVQQTGQIMVWKNSVVLPTPFLNIASLIVAGGEQGLLGLAFHPDYGNNGLFYVNYTRSSDGATVVARYSRSAIDPDVADPQSATILLAIAQPFANHNGGAVRFGPDGYLYIGMGDGGSGNDPFNNAQNLTSLLGKMLRIDVNTTTGPFAYGIPPDNPFVVSPQPGVPAEIWAYGLRNPFRFSFDKVAGDLFIGDVGQSAREEIDFVRAGSAGGMNFGWRVMEGALCTNLPGDPPCNPSSFTPPIFDYDHGQGCAVIGGYLYRGHAVPELIATSPPAAGQLFNGIYVYGDLCSGTIWRLNATAAGGVSNSVLFASGLAITTFGEDENGEIYVADAGAGIIYKLVSLPAAPTVDLAVAQAVTTPLNAGKDVAYQLTVSNGGPGNATGVSLIDTLPAGANFVWASPGCTNASGTVTCSIGALASGASTQIKLVVRPAAAGSMTNSASVSGAQTDFNLVNNTSSSTVTVTGSVAGVPVVRYRLYSPVTLEHLFTTDLNEYTVLGVSGAWNQEGQSGKVLNNPGSFNGVTAGPYYRLYNPGTRWHHWTSDANEYYTLVSFGWSGEGVDGYILPAATTGAIQLYRLVFNAIAGLHHWTIDANEYSVLTTSGAWTGEPGAGFVIQ